MNKLQSTTLSNKNISTELLLATFVATASQNLFISVCLNQIVGNGIYQIRVTRQLAGAGSTYSSKIVSETVPNGITSYVFNISHILADDTDIIKVYGTGLGGDTTTPDIITRFYEEDTKINIWENTTRTLTQTALEIASVVDGSEINIYNDTSVSITLTGLGSLSGYTEIYFSCKSNVSVPDENAILQISETEGLLYLYQTASPESTDGALSVDDETVGNITITLAPTSSSALPSLSGLYYDIKMITASSVVVLTSGRLNILQTITQAIS